MSTAGIATVAGFSRRAVFTPRCYARRPQALRYPAASMRVLILGGDGYLGWPTALRFSAGGHEVSVVDNFVRRRWVEGVRSDSLTPILDLDQRIAAWAEVSGNAPIGSYVGSVEDGEFLDQVVAETRPEAVVHYGQQASAPYSMASREQAVETQYGNVIGNLNLLFSIRDHVPECHLVKLGTMGEYGQPNIDIEEGYIEIEHKGRRDSLPFPKLPASLYHCSKDHDSTNIHFACRTWGLRATDLNQGVVYGIETEESARDERLMTRFDYDEVFGTVLNRFCVQAVIGHPLTVYGAGTQTRGFLNIRDTLACVDLAVNNAADAGESRVEKEQHYYNAVHTKLLDLGLEPTLLGEELVESMIHTIERYKGQAIESSIDPRTRWNPAKSPAGQA